MDAIVGLNIGGDDGRCEASSPMNGEQCELPAGHPGAHSAAGSAVAGTPPSCPDCGGPMAEFQVDAPSEEVAERVFVAYYATKHVPMDELKKVVAGDGHIHIAEGKSCKE